MPTIIPEEKARQGRWGRRVLIILIAGLLLAFIAWGLVEIFGKAIEPPGGGTVGTLKWPASVAAVG